MHRWTLACLVCVASALLSVSLAGLGTATPPAQPAVTADNEPWYLSGEPLTYEGNFYYPVGPQVAFNRNEMVRSGFYRGIPLYARTTIEPWSMVFVPLSNGFMQPYVRRRAGEIGGTIGSTSPGLPVERGDTSRALTRAPQAQGPPTGLMDTPVDRASGAVVDPRAAGTSGSVPAPPVEATVPAAAPEAIGTTAAARPRAVPVITASRPSGLNDIYVNFEAARWFSSGPAVELDSRFRKTGDYHGFPVYTREGDDSTIFIPVSVNVRTLVVPYSKTR